jgi:hypothetical protein
MEDILQILRRTATFNVNVYHECPFGTEIRKRLPPHHLVIEPLVSYAKEIRIYSPDEQSLLYDEVISMGRKERRHVVVDLSHDVVRGHERVWNAGSWERGAIVIATVVPRELLAGIFHWCAGPSVFSSMHQVRKGSPAGAITFAQKATHLGQLSFLFSASNGIQWMDIFAAPAEVEELFELALRSCRPFKRFCEHSPDKDEIIVDRQPYIGMI